MGAGAVLTEMRDLLQAQVEAVVAGDHQQVYAGALRHEELLRELEGAEMDLTPDALRVLVQDITDVKNRLSSLLSTEGARVDFLLRLILGGGRPTTGGYPDRITRSPAPAGRLNRRT